MIDEHAMDRVPVLYRDRVRAEWVDYNGHMSEAFYVLVFGYATDAFYDLIGMDDGYRRRELRSVYTLESHIFYLQEIGKGEELVVRTQVLGADTKRVRLFHSMHHGEQGELLATSELMLLHVDTGGPRAAPFDPRVQARLDTIVAAHAELPHPVQAGRAIRL
ncbi:MAG: thioesterase family protein [Gammaproteobacteria bacterium]|nr:thioesterase family protein [Gammaproteobacteria bacterium]